MDPQPPIPMNPPPPPYTNTVTVTSATEPPAPNHRAHVANPTPHHAPISHHPPYAEMITAAIAALKERNGSSKKAIAKYIDRVYTNLPSTHSSLLTSNLKRLKNSGQIVMVKHSYKLPSRSAPSPSLNNAAAISAADPLAQPKRSPGRPPKPKPVSITPSQDQSYNVGLVNPAQSFVPIVGPGENYNFSLGPTIQNEYQNFAVGPVPAVQKRKPGRPPKPKPFVAPLAQNAASVPPAAQHVVAPPLVQNTTLPPPVALGTGPVVGSEAMFVSLGLADGPAAAAAPVKRRPGRPRKGESAGPRQPRPKLLNQGGPKRKPGRPAKYGTGPNGVAPVALVSGKPRGRPRKGASAVVNGQPRGRGRRPKNIEPISAIGAVVPSAGGAVPQVEASGAVPNPVMVPYAQGPVAVPGVPHSPVPVPVAGNGVSPPATGRRRGRPPSANGGPNKRRYPSGKPLGRPKKNVSPPNMQQHFSALLDLQNKLDYMKLKIKQAVNVIKPCIDAGTSPSAIGALQQLEELASVVVNDGPVNVQGEQAVQQV